MGRKSRHGHNRYRMTTTKRKEERQSSTATLQKPVDHHSAVISPPISKIEPRPSIAATSIISENEKYAYVINELLEVGVLTAVILVLLIVLALLIR